MLKFGDVVKVIKPGFHYGAYGLVTEPISPDRPEQEFSYLVKVEIIPKCKGLSPFYMPAGYITLHFRGRDLEPYAS